MIDPAGLQAWASAIDTVGTLGLVVLAIWAFYTRRIRTKTEMDESSAEAQRATAALQKEHESRVAWLQTEHARQVTYIEERRADERQARLGAEQRLTSLVESIERMSDVLQAIQTELVRAVAARGGAA
jgi:hypothetical protein